MLKITESLISTGTPEKRHPDTDSFGSQEFRQSNILREYSLNSACLDIFSLQKFKQVKFVLFSISEREMNANTIDDHNECDIK